MATTETQNDLLSTNDLAKLADVTVPTVTRWVAEGRVTPVYKGKGLRGAFLFHRHEVERFLGARERELAG
jgi:phage terminase Nu1 subunit (DNA packaging protein)